MRPMPDLGLPTCPETGYSPMAPAPACPGRAVETAATRGAKSAFADWNSYGQTGYVGSSVATSDRRRSNRTSRPGG